MHKLLLLLVGFASLTAFGKKQLHLTETELRSFDGTDETKPIYLAIDGTIYDVSASPTFYGPGGHYHHFVGRDATRAWVTECWDSADQLTWRMDGVEKMFTPRYMDEELEKAKAGGDVDLDLGGMIGRDHLIYMADVALQRLGTVTDSQKAKRREDDEKEAKQKVHDTLAHWKDFFAKNGKYKAVGTVEYDEDGTPPPPAFCENALEKRPLKGGMLDAIMDLANMGRKADGSERQDMPDFVKARLDQENKQKAQDDEATKDEL